MSDYEPAIKGLHHNAYRVRDSEETRRFYEDFLGLRLASSLHVSETKTGRPLKFLHTFYEMADGSFLAFFEVPDGQHEGMFHERSDFDLHIALEVPDMDTLADYKARGEAAGMKVRGISDHGFIHSIYFTDPNGYQVELTCKAADYEQWAEQERREAHDILAAWQSGKSLANAG